MRSPRRGDADPQAVVVGRQIARRRAEPQLTHETLFTRVDAQDRLARRLRDPHGAVPVGDRAGARADVDRRRARAIRVVVAHEDPLRRVRDPDAASAGGE